MAKYDQSTFGIYHIDTDYISLLHDGDKNVTLNSGTKINRPYIGPYELPGFGNMPFFIPMSSKPTIRKFGIEEAYEEVPVYSAERGLRVSNEFRRDSNMTFDQLKEKYKLPDTYTDSSGQQNTWTDAIMKCIESGYRIAEGFPDANEPHMALLSNIVPVPPELAEKVRPADYTIELKYLQNYIDKNKDKIGLDIDQYISVYKNEPYKIKAKSSGNWEKFIEQRASHLDQNISDAMRYNIHRFAEKVNMNKSKKTPEQAKSQLHQTAAAVSKLADILKESGTRGGNLNDMLKTAVSEYNKLDSTHTVTAIRQKLFTEEVTALRFSDYPERPVFVSARDASLNDMCNNLSRWSDTFEEASKSVIYITPEIAQASASALNRFSAMFKQEAEPYEYSGTGAVRQTLKKMSDNGIKGISPELSEHGKKYYVNDDKGNALFFFGKNDSPSVISAIAEQTKDKMHQVIKDNPVQMSKTGLQIK